MKTLIAMLAVAALAQGPTQTGTLRIVVKDPSGAVIPNATVQIPGGEPARGGGVVARLTSDGRGVATALNVPVGRYTVAAEFPGFETRTLADVGVKAGDNRREIT